MVGRNSMVEAEKSVILQSLEESRDLHPPTGTMAGEKCLEASQDLEIHSNQEEHQIIKMKIKHASVDDADVRSATVKVLLHLGVIKDAKNFDPTESQIFAQACETRLDLEEVKRVCDFLAGDECLSQMITSENPRGSMMYQLANSLEGVGLDFLVAFCVDELRLRSLARFVESSHSSAVLGDRRDAEIQFEISPEGVAISSVLETIEARKQFLMVEDYVDSQPSLEQVLDFHCVSSHGAAERQMCSQIDSSEETTGLPSQVEEINDHGNHESVRRLSIWKRARHQLPRVYRSLNDVTPGEIVSESTRPDLSDPIYQVKANPVFKDDTSTGDVVVSDNHALVKTGQDKESMSVFPIVDVTALSSQTNQNTATTKPTRTSDVSDLTSSYAKAKRPSVWKRATHRLSLLRRFSKNDPIEESCQAVNIQKIEESTTTEMNKMKADLEDSRREIEELTQKMKDTQEAADSRVLEISDERDAAQMHLRKANEKKQEAQDNLLTLQDEHVSILSQLASAQSKLSASTCDYETRLCLEKHKSEFKLELLEADRLDAEARASKLEVDMNSTVQDYETKINDLHKEKDLVEERLLTLQDEHISTSVKLASLHSELTREYETRNCLEKHRAEHKLELLEADMAAAVARADKLEADMNSTVQDYESKMNNMRNEKEEVEEKLLALQDEHNCTRGKLLSHEQELRASSSEFEFEMCLEKHRSEHMLHVIEEDKAAAVARANKLEADMNSIIQDYETKIGKLTSAYQQEIEGIKNEREDAVNKLATLQTEHVLTLSQLISTQRTLSTTTSAFKTRINKLEHQVEETKYSQSDLKFPHAIKGTSDTTHARDVSALTASLSQSGKNSNNGVRSDDIVMESSDEAKAVEKFNDETNEFVVGSSNQTKEVQKVRVKFSPEFHVDMNAFDASSLSSACTSVTSLDA